MTLKAYNGRVVLEWLATCLETASRDPIDSRIPHMWVASTLSYLHIT